MLVFHNLRITVKYLAQFFYRSGVNSFFYFFKPTIMKKISGGIIGRFLLVFLLIFTQAVIRAQDSSSSSHSVTVTKETTTTSTNWYMQPWVWVVGAAVFIIILVALFRSNSSTKTDVSRSTTVIKEKEY